jgi:SAM-dependent methyltransferase
MKVNPLDRPFRIVAWPRYDDPEELAQLIANYRNLSWPWPKAQLILRVDPKLDGSTDSAGEAVRIAIKEVLGGQKLNVSLIDMELTIEQIRGVGAAVERLLKLPSSNQLERAAFLEFLYSGHQTRNLGNPVQPPIEATLLPADWRELVAKAAALDPWYMPVNLENVSVIPGKGMEGLAAGALEGSALWRDGLIVRAVHERFPLAGKSILELGCGCGWWASRYVMRGATQVVGVEGNERLFKQAELFWNRNRILLPGQFQLIQGDVEAEDTWAKFSRSFDLTLHADLHTVENLPAFLAKVAQATRSVFVADSRVSPARPLSALLAALKEAGFKPEILPADIPNGPGTSGLDSYADARRVTLFCRK